MKVRTKEYYKIRYQENKEKALLYRKKYYQENKEYIAKRQKAYYEENKEKIIKRQRLYNKKIRDNKKAIILSKKHNLEYILYDVKQLSRDKLKVHDIICNNNFYTLLSDLIQNYLN